MKIQKNQGRGKINKWCSSWFLKEKASLTLFPLRPRPCPCPCLCLSGSNSKFTWWRNPRSCGLQIPVGETTFDFLEIQMESHSARVRPYSSMTGSMEAGPAPPFTSTVAFSSCNTGPPAAPGEHLHAALSTCTPF